MGLGPWAWLALLAAAAPVPFRLLGRQSVVVPVLVNGEGPFDFVLDTGSSTTMIHRGLAERLALEPADRVALVTTGGSQVVPRSRLQRLGLGSKKVEDLMVLVSDLVGPRRTSERIRGVLGQNFLSRFNYTLDYERRQITVDEGGAQPQRAGIRLGVERNQGRILVAAQPPSAKGSTLRLVLDSGAGMLILFEDPSERLGLDIERSNGPPLTVTSGGGPWLSRSGRLRSLQLGDLTLRDLSVALFTHAGEGEGRVEQGLLPTLLFRSVYFNNREDIVVLSP